MSIYLVIYYAVSRAKLGLYSLVTDHAQVSVERDKCVQGSDVLDGKRVQVIGQRRAKTERLLLVYRDGAVQRHDAREIPAARPAAERAHDHLICTPVEFVFVHGFQYVLIACRWTKNTIIITIAINIV